MSWQNQTALLPLIRLLQAGVSWAQQLYRLERTVAKAAADAAAPQLPAPQQGMPCPTCS